MSASLLPRAAGLGPRPAARRPTRLGVGGVRATSAFPLPQINRAHVTAPFLGGGARTRGPPPCAGKQYREANGTDVDFVHDAIRLAELVVSDSYAIVDEDESPLSSGEDGLESAEGGGGKKKKSKKKEKAKKKLEKAAQAVQGYPSFRARWSDIKGSMRPCQAALGWDWAIYKMQKITTKEDAQRYMDIKPVPCVKRGKKWYTVDHHHTLVALEMSGFDVEVTVYEIMEIEKDGRSIESFWGYMEGKGWAFICDRNYRRKEGAWQTLPKSWDIRQFRNDIYRSMGGFCRVHKCLSRGERLEDQLFFEFRWAYFFHLHRDDEFGMWGDGRIHRAWLRLLRLVEETDMQEYLLDEVPHGKP